MSARLANSPAKSTKPFFPKRNVDIFSKQGGSSRRATKEDVITHGVFIDPYGDGERVVRAAVSSHLETGTARPQAAQRSPETAALGSGGATVPLGSGEPPLPYRESVSFKGSSSVQRWKLLNKIQKLCRPDDPDERGPAVCGCGRPGQAATHVNIHLRHGKETGEVRAGVSGIYRCGSPWLCPTCAVSKALQRAERVQAAANATFRRGGMSALVVLTASHDREMSLAYVKDLVQTASGKARKGRQWVNAVDLYKILGVICGQEVTYSLENGWHYHQHLSVMVDGPTSGELSVAAGDDQMLRKLVSKRAQVAGDWLAEAYKAQIRHAGGKVSDKHGCKVRVANDAADASDYTAKGSMAWEVSGANKDSTKVETSMTPWDLALRASEGDKRMFAKWKEYETTMPGTKSCVVSAALAKKLGIKLAEEEKECEGDEQLFHEQDDVVGRVVAPVWSRWMRHGLASTFLLRVEYGGEVGFAAAVEQTEAESQEIESRWQAQRAEWKRVDDEAQINSIKQTVSKKADGLFLLAANDVRRHQGETGTRRHVLDVVKRVARENPGAPLLDAAQVLGAAIDFRVDERDENWAIMRDALEELTGYKIAA